MTKQITVTEALSTLKLLDKKIAKQTKGLQFHVVEVKASNQVTVGQVRFKDVAEAETHIRSQYDKVKTLMQNRADLKGQVVGSNAVTKVTIGGKEMTVAEAIEMKSSIDAQLAIESRLAQSISVSTRIEEETERRIKNLIESKVQTLLGNKKTIDAGDDTLTIIDKQVRKSEAVVIHDPLNAAKLYDETCEASQEFLTNVDVILTVSNSTTKVNFG
jgi:hypothetical protein